MATVAPVQVQPAELVREPESLPAVNAESRVSELTALEPHSAINPLVARLAVELDVTVPIREFRVRNLLALEKGTVLGTRWRHGEDLPLSAGEVQLAWTEFEVVETRLAVRITRLA